MNRTAAGCFIAALLMALLISVGFNILQSLAMVGRGVRDEPRPKDRMIEEMEVEGKGDGGERIVRIDLEGIITSVDPGGLFGTAVASVDRVKQSLEQAVGDPKVKAIVLHINSPGGEVTASDTLYAAVKAAAAQKPVIVFMNAMAASGGYYIACGATRIVASETTLTGSIGVIMESLSYHELFGKVGLDMETFTSGAFKDSLSGSRPMRDDERAYVQNLVNQMYDRFLAIVAEARQLPPEQLRTTVADGRVVTGREALAAKLVDQVGYIEDAYTLARELGKAPGAMVVKYRSGPNFLRAFGLAAERASAPQTATLDLSVAGRGSPPLQPGVLYYLPSLFAR